MEPGVKRAFQWVAAGLLAGTMLAIVFSAVAALDQSARVPFSSSLLGFTILVNAAAFALSRVAVTARAIVAARPILWASSWSSARPVRPEQAQAGNLATTPGVRVTPASSDVRRAVAKVHSVAWLLETEQREVGETRPEVWIRR